MSPRIREVGGLNELEHESFAERDPEMAANDGKESKLNSERSPVTDSSTLAGSSTRGETHR